MSAARRQIADLEDRIARLDERLAALEGPQPEPLLFDPFRRLNPTEKRIAELVAKGCTNHEVASRLFFSPKTVEWNLSKIYRKVHVRSRTELAAESSRRHPDRGSVESISPELAARTPRDNRGTYRALLCQEPLARYTRPARRRARTRRPGSSNGLFKPYGVKGQTTFKTGAVVQPTAR